MFENKWLYMGVTSPSGQSWCNFDPCTYLDCGIWGSMRVFDYDENDKLIDDYVPTLESLTWNEFAELLYTGAIYE